MDETPSRSLQPAVHTTTPDAKVQPQFCHNLFVGFWVSDLTSVCFSFICKIWQLSCRVKVKIAQSCPTLCDSIDWSMEFSRPEYWSGQPFPSPEDLPNPRIEPRTPALQADSLPAEPQGKPSRPFRYELNQIPYNYTVEATNRFKGSDLIEHWKNYGQRFATLYRRW